MSNVSKFGWGIGIAFLFAWLLSPEFTSNRVGSGIGNFFVGLDGWATAHDNLAAKIVGGGVLVLVAVLIFKGGGKKHD